MCIVRDYIFSTCPNSSPPVAVHCRLPEEVVPDFLLLAAVNTIDVLSPTQTANASPIMVEILIVGLCSRTAPF